MSKDDSGYDWSCVFEESSRVSSGILAIVGKSQIGTGMAAKLMVAEGKGTKVLERTSLRVMARGKGKENQVVSGSLPSNY